MQNNSKYFFLIYFILFSIVVIFSNCSDYDIIQLKNAENEKFTYYASEKFGYKIDIEKQFGNMIFNYIIQLTKSGKIISIYKFPIDIFDASDASTKNLQERRQFLVSDTSDTTYGAKLFGKEILGYYNSENINYIMSNKYKGVSVPVKIAENALFIEVTKLTHENGIEYIPMPSLDNVFWFKYTLNE
ncbi:MAG: hypothetical protein ABIT96_04225 [Ferruginibacter sp.]